MLRRTVLWAAAMLLAAQPLIAQEATSEVASADNSNNSFRVLLVTGGCCHDYEFQTKAMQLAAKQAGYNVEWTVVNRGGNGTKAEIDLYNDGNWAADYDVVIHNECFADTTDPEYIRKITSKHHEGVNAVVIHCAMHTYRAAEIDDWREFLGVTSKRHEHQSKYSVRVAAPENPIVSSIPEGYTSAMDELYVIDKVWPNTQPLAYSKSEVDGKEYPVIWTNQYGKARVFGTTYGHSTDTFKDEVFLKTLIAGLKWAATGE